MKNLLMLRFEAHHQARNHHRSYRLAIGRDLFGMWTLSTTHGRVGQLGCERHYSASDPDIIRNLVRERLLRRLSAPSRIGCAYRLAEVNPYGDREAERCLPGDLLDRFELVAGGPGRDARRFAGAAPKGVISVSWRENR